MTLALHVDAERWRSSTKAVCETTQRNLGADDPQSGLVPVVEGNGCGLGLARLAREAIGLGVDALAVHSPFEAEAVLDYFPGDILVRQPWDPRDAVAAESWARLTAAAPDRVLRTVASTEVLHRLAGQADRPVPVVLEGLTSVHRFGLRETDLDALLADDTIRTALRAGRLDIRGASLRLPERQPGSPQVSTTGSGQLELPPTASNRVREAWGWAVLWIRALAAVEEAGVELSTRSTTLWLSRLGEDETLDLRAALPEVPVRLCLGAALWLAEPTALQAYGTVLAVHEVDRGREFGEHQRRAAREGYIVVVGGGVSHGVGVDVPTGQGTLRSRAAAARSGALGAIGRTPSPFYWAGRRRRFAEAPHSATSAVWLGSDDVRESLAAGHRTPAVGDQWPCACDPRTTTFDRVLGLD